MNSICFFMFIDEETHRHLNTSEIKNGVWRLVVVHNLPYSDARRNGKVRFLQLVWIALSFLIIMHSSVRPIYSKCFLYLHIPTGPRVIFISFFFVHSSPCLSVWDFGLFPVVDWLKKCKAVKVYCPLLPFFSFFFWIFHLFFSNPFCPHFLWSCTKLLTLSAVEPQLSSYDMLSAVSCLRIICSSSAKHWAIKSCDVNDGLLVLFSIF